MKRTDMMIQEELKKISSYVSKLLRQKFGRGPEACYASAGSRFLVITVRGFLSPMEEVLLQHDKEDSVDRTRSIIVTSMLPELKGVISVSLGVEVDRFYHDWNYSSNAGVIVAVFEKDLPFATSVEGAPLHKTMDIEAFREEVNRISGYVQKAPEGLEIHSIGPKLYVIMRLGILIPIEKALLERGFDRELRIAKDQLEKQLFQQSPVFAQLLGGAIENVFVDWNFANDEGIVCFQLK
ncbi:MAG TPA: Na-translocating system protein MpsC family protein [Paenibacillus sp.]|nr:Na-translocating system protein MpsC family protein [Paenibacillus sp.]